MVIALNLWDEAAHTGVKIDVKLLEEALGLPCVPLVALTGEGELVVPVNPPDARYLFPVRGDVCRDLEGARDSGHGEGSRNHGGHRSHDWRGAQFDPEAGRLLRWRVRCLWASSMRVLDMSGAIRFHRRQ